MRYAIEDFITETNVAVSHDEVFVLYQRAIKRFGYDSAVYTFVTDHRETKQKAGHGIKCNFPDDWMRHYWAKGYNKIDPVTLKVLQGANAFTWEQLAQSSGFTKQQQLILEEAREAGLNNGVGIPLYRSRGEIAGVGLASIAKEKILVDKNILCKLKLITEQFHLTYCSLGAV